MYIWTTMTWQLLSFAKISAVQEQHCPINAECLIQKRSLNHFYSTQRSIPLLINFPVPNEKQRTVFSFTIVVGRFKSPGIRRSFSVARTDVVIRMQTKTPQDSFNRTPVTSPESHPSHCENRKSWKSSGQKILTLTYQRYIQNCRSSLVNATIADGTIS